jgi:hypothetical protein
MLVYTITVNVEQSVTDQWLLWMKENFLGAMLATGFFQRYNAFKVLHDSDGDTYTFQFFCSDILQFEQFSEPHKGIILQSLMNSYPGKVVYFNTMLEELKL